MTKEAFPIILIALIFVALVHDARFTAASTDAVPIDMLIDTLFLLIFILLLKYGLITIISTFAGIYWVGLFSTFPAVMLSTMVILILNQGADFVQATGNVMILASTNIIV